MKYFITIKISFFYIFLIMMMNIGLTNKLYSQNIDPDVLTNKDFSSHSYVCIPDKNSGFYYDLSKKNWKGGTTTSLPKKMLLKWMNNQWHWSEFGKNNDQVCERVEYPWATRSDKNNDLNKKYHITLRCTLSFGELVFSKETLRYIETNTTGYIFGDDTGSSVSFIEIGTCAKL